MSHLTWHAPHAFAESSHRVMLIVGGVLALAAAVAVVLVLAIGGSGSTNPGVDDTLGLPKYERPGPSGR